MMRTAISAASSSAAPASALGTNSRAGSWPISGRIRCGATRPMKPMVPVTATAPPTPSATPAITSSRSRRDIDAEALRGLLAEAERAKGAALAEQDDAARDDERQRQHDVLKAAVLQRAEQPERDLQHHERDCWTGSSPARSRRPQELEIARPARIRISSPALRPAIASSTNTEPNAAMMAATGSA